MFRDKKNKQREQPSNNAVTVYRPQHPQVQPNQPVYMRDPHSGELVEVQQNPQGYVPTQTQPSPPPAIPTDQGDFIGFEGRMGVRIHPDGTEEFVYDGHVRGRKTTKAGQGCDGTYDPRLGRISKRRIFAGAVLVLLVLMIFVDVMGVPHVRTEPGTYVSLEGAKEVASQDAPLVILKRLDRSVFGYTFDAVGWVFSAVGSAIESDSDTGTASGEEG
ncbi:MAG: hypothetical protein AAGI37_09125 [Planctomycetota bacterium]